MKCDLSLLQQYYVRCLKVCCRQCHSRVTLEPHQGDLVKWILRNLDYFGLSANSSLSEVPSLPPPSPSPGEDQSKPSLPRSSLCDVISGGGTSQISAGMKRTLRNARVLKETVRTLDLNGSGYILFNKNLIVNVAHSLRSSISCFSLNNLILYVIQ